METLAKRPEEFDEDSDLGTPDEESDDEPKRKQKAKKPAQEAAAAAAKLSNKRKGFLDSFTSELATAADIVEDFDINGF